MQLKNIVDELRSNR